MHPAAHVVPQLLWNAEDKLGRNLFGGNNAGSTIQGAAPLLTELSDVGVHVKDHQPISLASGEQTQSAHLAGAFKDQRSIITVEVALKR